MELVDEGANREDVEEKEAGAFGEEDEETCRIDIETSGIARTVSVVGIQPIG